MYVCLWNCRGTMCVFHSPTISPSQPEHHRVDYQERRLPSAVRRMDIADWGIITRAIKERFTEQPVSGVSTVFSASISGAGSLTKSPKQRIAGRVATRIWRWEPLDYWFWTEVLLMREDLGPSKKLLSALPLQSTWVPIIQKVTMFSKKGHCILYFGSNLSNLILKTSI